MDIDVHLYIKSLRDFFESNEEGRSELISHFPGVEFSDFMGEIEKVAIHNYEERGDPTVSKKQILDILQILHTQVMRDGLQDLIDSGEITIEEVENGVPHIHIEEPLKKEFDELKVFQDSNLGRICLN